MAQVGQGPDRCAKEGLGLVILRLLARRLAQIAEGRRTAGVIAQLLPERQTVRVEGPRGFGLDASGATRRLLSQHYRSVATVCGSKMLLARGAHVLPAPKAGGCG